MPDLAKLTFTTQIELTAHQIAEAFWELSADAQAEFFVHLGNIAFEYDPPALDLQMAYVADALREHEDKRGIETFCKMAQYAYKFGRLDEPAEKWML